jgi:hypothetical protein
MPLRASQRKFGKSLELHLAKQKKQKLNKNLAKQKKQKLNKNLAKQKKQKLNYTRLNKRYRSRQDVVS